MILRQVKTILIVDDDPDFRELLQVFLHIKGIATKEASDCKSAVDLLRKENCHVDAILLDYYMPGLTPCCCVDQLREVTDGATPIILITAAVDAASRARELHLKHYLSKPFDMETLVRTVFRVTGSSFRAAADDESWIKPTASLD